MFMKSCATKVPQFKCLWNLIFGAVYFAGILLFVKSFSDWYPLLYSEEIWAIWWIVAIILQQFARDPIVPVKTVRPDNSEKALYQLCEDVNRRTKGKGLDLLIAILPDNNGSLYGMFSFKLRTINLIPQESVQDFHNVLDFQWWLLMYETSSRCMCVQAILRNSVRLSWGSCLNVVWRNMYLRWANSTWQMLPWKSMSRSCSWILPFLLIWLDWSQECSRKSFLGADLKLFKTWNRWLFKCRWLFLFLYVHSVFDRLEAEILFWWTLFLEEFLLSVTNPPLYSVQMSLIRTPEKIRALLLRL